MHTHHVEQEDAHWPETRTGVRKYKYHSIQKDAQGSARVIMYSTLTMSYKRVTREPATDHYVHTTLTISYKMTPQGPAFGPLCTLTHRVVQENAHCQGISFESLRTQILTNYYVVQEDAQDPF